MRRALDGPTKMLGETMTQPIYNNSEDLRAIRQILLPGEELEAVFRFKPEPLAKGRYSDTVLTLIGITVRRVILRYSTYYKNGGGHMRDEYESLPYHKIGHVKLYASRDIRENTTVYRGLEIMILYDKGGYHYKYVLQGDEARRAHDLILAHLL